MKVLVAGKGFIGSNIGGKLEENGHEVSYLDRSDADYQYDITEEFEIEEEFDILVHTIGLPPGFNTEQEYREVMVDGTRHLLDAVEADKVIYISALRAGEIDHSFFHTKRESEQILIESGMDYTIIRPSTVIGEGNKLLEMIKKTAPTRVFPNIKTWTQPIRIEDLAELASKCLEEHDGEILNAGGPRKYQVGEMARQIYREEGYQCILLPFPVAAVKMALEPGILPRPFFRENKVLLETRNTTDENDAAEIVDLKSAF
jgi:NADH dehydrogenase